LRRASGTGSLELTVQRRETEAPAAPAARRWSTGNGGDVRAAEGSGGGGGG
jgi:hypothetical protein